MKAYRSDSFKQLVDIMKHANKQIKMARRDLGDLQISCLSQLAARSYHHALRDRQISSDLRYSTTISLRSLVRRGLAIENKPGRFSITTLGIRVYNILDATELLHN